MAYPNNTTQGKGLNLREKPSILKDYFKWHHNPSKAYSIALPKFSEEVVAWWVSIQPDWRYTEAEFSPGNPQDYSYILAGGKKGLFLLILCLAWWDRAYGRDIERVKTSCRQVVGSGTDRDTLNFDDLRDHEPKWFNLVSDLIRVMEHAQACPLPNESSPGAIGAVPIPARKKRTADRGDASSPRKKKKSS